MTKFYAKNPQQIVVGLNFESADEYGSLLETKCRHCTLLKAFQIKPEFLAPLRLRFQIFAILNTPTESNDNDKKEFKKSYVICSVKLGRRVVAGGNPPMNEKEILECC